MSETKMEKFIESLEDTYGLDNQEGIRLAVSQLKRSDVNDMAYRWVLRCIAMRVRTETLRVERASEVSTADMHESPGPVMRKTVGGSTSDDTNWKNPNRMGKAEWAKFIESPEYPEWQEREREWRERESELKANLWKSMNESLRIYTDEMRVQWTDELLNSQFNLPDGTSVTWGTATRDQHEARYEMFKTNAMANLEGAARHKKAIDDLNASGVSTLFDLVPMEVAA